MISQDTIEGQVRKLENEVVALKKSQPFYDGQFTTYLVETPNVSDFVYATTKVNTIYDITLEFDAPAQSYPIFEPYIEGVTNTGTRLSILNADYSWRQSVSTNGNTKVTMTLFTYGFPIGTEIRLKLTIISSSLGNLTLTGGQRP